MVSAERGSAAVEEREGRTAAEATLLRAGLAGDRAALDQLLALHERPLLALCQGMLGHAEDAEDAAQETFLRALRSLSRFRGDATFRTWLFRIAVNVCLNWKRDRRPTEPWDEVSADTPSDAASPEAIVLRRLQVTDALSQLSPHHRAIFLLKVLEGWSVAEISTAMGWSRIRVQNELSRARRALAERRREWEEGT
jgi:RNA polymerase sigma-70 factor (ECF subfamily)